MYAFVNAESCTQMIASSVFSSVQSLDCVRLFVTPWIAAHQASLSITISQTSLKLKSIKLDSPNENTTTTTKLLQSCPTLCDPIDGSPPGSAIPGILQTRTLEWVAISFSNAWKWKVKVNSLSNVQLLATPWTAAYQAPPSTGFSRQEYWSGVTLPSPSVIIGEVQIKITILYHYTPIKMPKNFYKLTIELLVSMQRSQSSRSLLVRMQNCSATLEDIFLVF